MNKINCPKCGFANETDLNFCLNCGAALRAQSASSQPLTSAAPTTHPNAAIPGSAASSLNAIAKPTRGGAGKNLAIFGGLGCIGLALGSVALLGLLFYISANANNKNARNVAVVNVNANRAANRQSNAANKNAEINSGSASDSASGASDADANDDSTSGSSTSGGGGNNNSDTITEAQTAKILGEQLGAFKRQGAIVSDASVEMDGAQTASKADYAFNKQLVEAFVIEFADPDAAKNGYTDFLSTSRADAKIVKREKIAGKNNANGEVVIYSFKESGKTRHEALFYAGKYAFHITASDQLTLSLFLIAFGTNMGTAG